VLLHLGAQELRATLLPAWLQSRPWARRQPAEAATSPGKGITVVSALAQPVPEALVALLAELAQQAELRQASLQVTLADAHVHFDVVAGDFATYSDPQLQAIARGCVAELLGDAAADQSVCWQLQPDLHHLLVCAMDRQLVNSLVQAAALHHMRLDSLQPVFCQHWNRHAVALPRGTGVFTVLDAGRSLVACALRGSITALSYGAWTTPAQADAAPHGQALDQQVDRLLASVGQQARELVDFVLLAQEPLAVPPSPRWTVLNREEEAT
jgi:hypothetical protein